MFRRRGNLLLAACLLSGTLPAMAGESERWAFQPIVRPAVPAVQHRAWVRNPIDAFILARLEQQGIEPSPDADRRALIRRLSFDLIGLPPTPEEVDTFLSDRRPGAYQRLVDRLLDSPHYGERWGRIWLDRARYADSDGYSNDDPRQMWGYRDWVIDAWNRDLPFDQFTIQQIAGDLLPSEGLEDGARIQQVVATGFHRNTQRYSEADSANEEYRVENVVDRVHTTGVVFLGLTLGCARCHDHMYDPISQKEFYQLFAFLNNQDEPAIDVPGKTSVLVMQERSEPRETRIHIRGDYLDLGEPVLPGVPSVLPPLPAGTGKPNRLDLARWLVSAENPLTPRVTVNSIWQTYFGVGIVATEGDFGAQGERPTHPELLDWLAAELMHRGWSLKSLHRLIVTSSTYRQSSQSRPDLDDVDRDNRLLARQNRLRLDAELIRDAALEASGLLSRKLKGPGVYPPQPEGVMRFTQHATRGWTASAGQDRYRRGMYTFFWRLTPHPFLILFDAPAANTTCTRRPRSNTPLQALTMLNDETFVECAQALAVRVLREAPSSDSEERTAFAFRLCLGRPPTAAESDLVRELLQAEQADPEHAGPLARFPSASGLPDGASGRDVAAWTTVARALLNLDEFITRE